MIPEDLRETLIEAKKKAESPVSIVAETNELIYSQIQMHADAAEISVEEMAGRLLSKGLQSLNSYIATSILKESLKEE